MMSERQIKQKIAELERELAILRAVLETQSDNTMGRPFGSTKYNPERLVFLEQCEKEGISDKEIIERFNAKFGTQIKPNSRQLYNLMQRKGIRKTGWRWSI